MEKCLSVVAESGIAVDRINDLKKLWWEFSEGDIFILSSHKTMEAEYE